MEKHTTTKKRAGKKPDVPEKSRKLFVIYKNCYDCPLKVYIDIVCDNNINSLTISGNPPHEVLEKAKDEIIAEFSDLIGGGNINKKAILLKNIYTYRSQITGLKMCIYLIMSGHTDEAVVSLNKLGVKCSTPENEKELYDLIDKVINKIKDRDIRGRKLNKEYIAQITRNEKVRKIDKSDFIEQIVELSKWAGFRLTTDITLAEYASYIRSMNKYIETMKSKTIKNG